MRPVWHMVFSKKERGINATAEWVVLCTYSKEGIPPMADEGDFLCGCLNDRQWIYLHPAEISSLPWTGEKMTLAKSQELYNRFLED